MSDTPTAPAGMPGDWTNRLKANDEKLLKAIYEANFSKVERYVHENSGSRADAEDVFQEAFISAWRNVQLDKARFDSIDQFNGYLFRIAQYKWIDLLRWRQKEKLVSATVINTNQLETELGKDEQDYLNKVVAGFRNMEEPCKSILHRFYFLKHSMREIAESFSWTEATAKNNKYRCLQRLRKNISLKNPNLEV